MTKMPQARAKALDASFPTLVEDGSECLRIRRTQAKGGSNSSAAAPVDAAGDLAGGADVVADGVVVVNGLMVDRQSSHRQGYLYFYLLCIY